MDDKQMKKQLAGELLKVAQTLGASFDDVLRRIMERGWRWAVSYEDKTWCVDNEVYARDVRDFRVKKAVSSLVGSFEDVWSDEARKEARS